MRAPMVSWIAVASVTLGLLGACSSSIKKANEALEKGLHDQAITQYEAILKSDPNHAEAAAGLKSARVGYLEQRLITARMTRISGNPEGAMETLLEVVRKQSEWKLPPSAKAALTQEEETGFALGYTETKVTRDLKAGFPLSAEHFLRKFQPVFSGDFQRRYQGMRAATQQQGKKSCKSLKTEKVPGKPYFARFITRYCQLWGESAQEIGRHAQIPMKGFYRGVELQKEPTSALTEEQKLTLQEDLLKALSSTAWFDVGGMQNLKSRIAGAYQVSHQKTPISQTHAYTVEVPHTEHVQVTKQREVPYHTMESQYEPGTQAYRQVPVVRYRTENYTVSEPRTAYRPETRYHYYRATKHDISLSLNLSTSGLALQGQPLALSVSDSHGKNAIEHHENLPAIGLKPAIPELPDSLKWYKEKSALFSKQFEEKAASLWKELYCKNPEDAGSFSAIGDSVQRCLRQAMTDYPAMSEEWHQKHFGVRTSQAIELLGRM